ncbi:MAG: hypothetical protein ACKO34_04495 [Vampirovibrionales bacterium]
MMQAVQPPSQPTVLPPPEDCLAQTLHQRLSWLQYHCQLANLHPLPPPKGVWQTWLMYRLGFTGGVALLNGYTARWLFRLWCYSVYPWPWQHAHRLACQVQGACCLDPTASVGQWAYAYFLIYHWQRHPNSLGHRFLLNQFLEQKANTPQGSVEKGYSRHHELGLLNALRCEEEALDFVQKVCEP